MTHARFKFWYPFLFLEWTMDTKDAGACYCYVDIYGIKFAQY